MAIKAREQRKDVFFAYQAELVDKAREETAKYIQRENERVEQHKREKLVRKAVKKRGGAYATGPEPELEVFDESHIPNSSGSSGSYNISSMHSSEKSIHKYRTARQHAPSREINVEERGALVCENRDSSHSSDGVSSGSRSSSSGSGSSDSSGDGAGSDGDSSVGSGGDNNSVWESGVDNNTTLVHTTNHDHTNTEDSEMYSVSSMSS